MNNANLLDTCLADLADCLEEDQSTRVTMRWSGSEFVVDIVDADTGRVLASRSSHSLGEALAFIADAAE